MERGSVKVLYWKRGCEQLRLTDKTERWSMGNKTLVGRKKNYEVKILFSAKNYVNETEYWWFSIHKKDIKYSYNSLWDSLKFKTKEECVAACEKKVDELSKRN